MSTRARIATVCLGQKQPSTIEQNRTYVLSLLDRALTQRPDLVCLPETCTTVSVTGSIEELAEPLDGPSIEAAAHRARAHRCYVIFPLLTRREDRFWNSAVLIDRTGAIVGVYDKAHPVTTSPDYTCLERGTTPGREVPVFDLDFGRVGIQICFDAGFPEPWAQLAAQGARLVFWPSAYNGGFPLQVYAYLHHYYVISSVQTDTARMIDPCGKILEETDSITNVIIRDINLDYVVCHYDFNYSIPDLIAAAYPGRVAIRSHKNSAHFMVEPLDDTLTIAQLQHEFGFESTQQYHQRHHTAYQALRQGEPAPAQAAAHGTRPMYAKWA